MPALTKGQNGPLPTADVVVTVESAAPADLSALLVTGAGKVRSDTDFVFFNQPDGPGVRLVNGALHISTNAVPADIAQIRAVLTLDDPAWSFGRFPAPIARVVAGNPLYEYRIDSLSTESVVIAIEIYRRGDEWKVRAVGQGYAGGFADLVTDHGVSVDSDTSDADEPMIRSVPEEAALSFEKKQKLDMRKRAVAKVLLTKGAKDVRARVVLVLDKTGSMQSMYRSGLVNRVVERMVPVAVQVDDDGRLEPYLYARQFLRLPDITVGTLDPWCAEYLHLKGVHGGLDYDSIGHSNDEIPIITEIIATLRTPTLVLFFTDGGFSRKQQIRNLLRDASSLPAFWQFIGLGQANYGLLRELDTLEGRVVDNAGFFAVDDIDKVGDDELYRRLLHEFPDWLRAAQTARIIG